MAADALQVLKVFGPNDHEQGKAAFMQGIGARPRMQLSVTGRCEPDHGQQWTNDHPLSAQVGLQHAATTGMLHAPDGLFLDLAHTFTGEIELLPDLLQRVRLVAVQAEV